jgi:hypothetical protein
MGYYLAGAACTLAAFGFGLWVGRGRRTVALAASGLTLLLLVVKATFHYRPAFEAAIFPWPDYIYFRSTWFYPIALFYLGLAVPLLREMRLKRAVAGFAAFVFAAALAAESWMLVPPDEPSEQVADAAHHCVQTRPYTGAPAACVALLSRWGIDATEGEMAALCRTRTEGTTLYHVYRGLRLKTRGGDLEARIVEADADGLRRRGLPAVILVGEGPRGRALTVSFRDGHVVVDDPALPEGALWTPDRFARLYRGSAVLLEARS